MGNFGVDWARALAERSSEPLSPWGRARVGLFNIEFHCVACYRFGRYALDLRKTNPFRGLILWIIYRLWNRRVLTIHHCDINAGAMIGPGLLITHRTGIIIGPVVIGERCTLHHNVTIGEQESKGRSGVPRIGNDAWICPNSVLAGPITIGDGVAISAGTILTKDIPSHCLVGGNPGRILVHDYDIHKPPLIASAPV